MKPLVRICFDTNAWISILENEPHADLASLGAWMDAATRGEATLLVPTIVATEASVGKSATSTSIDQFEKVLLNPFVDVLDLTAVIAISAGKLRRQVLDTKRKLRTPDAIVIASAILYGADFIISTDADVLRLNGFPGIKPVIGPPATGLKQPGLL